MAAGAADFAGCEPEALGSDLAAGAPDFAGCEPEALGGDSAGGTEGDLAGGESPMPSSFLLTHRLCAPSAHVSPTPPSLPPSPLHLSNPATLLLPDYR